MEALAARANSLKVGPGMDPETEMGPLVSAKQQQTVLNYIEKGKQKGHALWLAVKKHLKKDIMFSQPFLLM